MLVLDETGSLKKGSHSAGVARQSTGTAGRIENAQVGVFLAYASRHGTTFIDHALYLPKGWADDRDRCEEAGLPEATAFATKLRLAEQMLGRAFEAAVRATWVVGDEVFGSDGGLRRWLGEQPASPYALAVRINPHVWAGFRESIVAALAKSLTKRAWHEVTIAVGSKGPRRYTWAWVAVKHALGPKWRRWLLIRSSLDQDAGAALLPGGRPGPHDANPVGQDGAGSEADRGRIRVGQL